VPESLMIISKQAFRNSDRKPGGPPIVAQTALQTPSGAAHDHGCIREIARELDEQVRRYSGDGFAYATDRQQFAAWLPPGHSSQRVIPTTGCPSPARRWRGSQLSGRRYPIAGEPRRALESAVPTYLPETSGESRTFSCAKRGRRGRDQTWCPWPRRRTSTAEKPGSIRLTASRRPICSAVNSTCRHARFSLNWFKVRAPMIGETTAGWRSVQATANLRGGPAHFRCDRRDSGRDCEIPLAETARGGVDFLA